MNAISSFTATNRRLHAYADHSSEGSRSNHEDVRNIPLWPGKSLRTPLALIQKARLVLKSAGCVNNTTRLVYSLWRA